MNLSYVFIQNDLNESKALMVSLCPHVRGVRNSEDEERRDGCGGGEEEGNLTFGKGVRLNNVEIGMDHVEEDPHGPRLVVSVGVINRRRYKPKIQRLHRWRGPLSAGVRPDLGGGSVPLIRLLLAACGPPEEQQDEPPCPQHGSEKSSSVQKKKKEKKKKQQKKKAPSRPGCTSV